MKKLSIVLFILSYTFNIQAQQVRSYLINVEFFSKDAQMWSYPVSNDSFMKGNSTIELSNSNSDRITFYLHGELKIDSIVSENKSIKYDSEKILYRSDYSRVALKTSINSSDINPNKKFIIYYSGFMNPSRVRSLSDICILIKIQESFFDHMVIHYGFRFFLSLVRTVTCQILRK